jgi:signal peptidase II
MSAAGRSSVAETMARIAPAAGAARDQQSRSRLGPMLAFVTAPVVLIDQLSKIYVRAHFELNQTIPLIPGWLDVTYTRNPGAAFSLFATMPQWFRHGFFLGISLAAIVVLIVLMARRTTPARTVAAFALVLGGTIGNLIDRLSRGLVTDFIYFHHASFSYPVFNIADSAITVGVAMILLFTWLDDRSAARAV